MIGGHWNTLQKVEAEAQQIRQSLRMFESVIGRATDEARQRAIRLRTREQLETRLADVERRIDEMRR